MELVLRARAGDAQALDRLCRLHRPRLLRWARGRLPHWARGLVDTDDLVQETLIQTVRRVDGFDPKHSGAFQAYLRRALDNRVRDEIRRVGRRPQAEEIADEHPHPCASPLEEAIGTEAVATYERALDSLSDEDQSLVVARIELELGFDEIARLTGRTTGDAARMAVSRALVRLAEAMDRG